MQAVGEGVAHDLITVANTRESALDADTQTRTVPVGDGGASFGTAAWIAPEHGPFFVMSKSMYTTPQQLIGPWSLLPEYTTPRNAVWKAGEMYALAAKGTSSAADVLDDVQLALRIGTDANLDVSLVTETKAVMDKLIKLMGSAARVTLTGHSLGGWAAVQTRVAYPGSRSIVFNGAAPPTNPVLVPDVAYHIAGDIISAHAAGATRIDQGYTFPSLEAHELARFEEPGQEMSVDEEQLLWLLTAYSVEPGADPSSFGGMWGSSPITNIKQFAAGEFVAASPIPGSSMYGNYAFWSGYLERDEIGYYFLVKTGMSGIVMPLDQFAHAYAGLAGESADTFIGKTVDRGPGLFPANEWEVGFAQGNATVKALETIGITLPGAGLIAPAITALIK